MPIRFLRFAAVVSLFAAFAFPADRVAAQGRSSQALAQARDRMVDQEVIAAGVSDPRVIKSMRMTPRHLFVSTEQIPYAYYDMSLPIGAHQTISPPVIVAYMTQELDPLPTDKVLEIGTGSGYQAAILSPLVKDVYSIEIIESLGRHAAQTLKQLKYKNIHTKIGDGYLGWPDEAPFDKIIVTCSPDKVPQPLVDQLKEGGRMVIPVGERYQQVLYLYKKQGGKLIKEALKPTLFVPMTGTAATVREDKPDPLHPHLVNGGFEQITGTSGEPTGWYYIRQMKVVTAADAPEGKNYVTFSNAIAGRGCRALQGFAIDGREVHELEVSCMAKGKDIRRAPQPGLEAEVMIVFYDANRAIAGTTFLDPEPFRGTFDWQRKSQRLHVPGSAREAIMNIGLVGATGELSLDDVRMGVAPEVASPRK
ncbi:MAG TPA: protein-L-isoaspartate(D-aspartate) O-methyltransferase [Pirellulales bacterium]|nr:protein-L-isoaspartate(D-aspartate) O-methyltransferase [Pirellulales bacterium]